LCWFQIWIFSCCVHGLDFGPIFVLGGFSFGFLTRALRSGPHPLRALGFPTISLSSAVSRNSAARGSFLPKAQRRRFFFSRKLGFSAARGSLLPKAPRRRFGFCARVAASPRLCCFYAAGSVPICERARVAAPKVLVRSNRAATTSLPSSLLRFVVRSVLVLPQSRHRFCCVSSSHLRRRSSKCSLLRRATAPVFSLLPELRRHRPGVAEFLRLRFSFCSLAGLVSSSSIWACVFSPAAMAFPSA
jgi:hypothetical protein